MSAEFVLLKIAPFLFVRLKSSNVSQNLAFAKHLLQNQVYLNPPLIPRRAAARGSSSRACQPARSSCRCRGGDVGIQVVARFAAECIEPGDENRSLIAHLQRPPGDPSPRALPLAALPEARSNPRRASSLQPLRGQSPVSATCYLKESPRQTPGGLLAECPTSVSSALAAQYTFCICSRRV